MDLHTLENPAPRSSRKRKGRGNGNNWGRTCGRGEKGQMSRSGANHRPHFEGGQIPLIRRLPKRGFNHATHKFFAIVNISQLQARFADGDVVDGDSLRAKGLIGKELDGIKILGDGELSIKLTVKVHRFSASAKEKIEAAGGTCESI